MSDTSDNSTSVLLQACEIFFRYKHQIAKCKRDRAQIHLHVPFSLFCNTDMYENTGSGRLLAHCEPDNMVGMIKRFQNRFVEAVKNNTLVGEVRKGNFMTVIL